MCMGFSTLYMYGCSTLYMYGFSMLYIHTYLSVPPLFFSRVSVISHTTASNLTSSILWCSCRNSSGEEERKRWSRGRRERRDGERERRRGKEKGRREREVLVHVNGWCAQLKIINIWSLKYFCQSRAATKTKHTKIYTIIIVFQV